MLTFNFVKPTNYVSPKQDISHSGGYLVLETDDGRVGDYTGWFPTLKKVSRKFSKFYPYNLAKACPNINTADLNLANDRMTNEQLLELYNYGWEIMSHGRHHTDMGLRQLQQSADVGDTEIYINRVSWIKPHLDLNDYEGADSWDYTYRIWEGATEEEVTIIDFDTNNNFVTISEGLTNSYTTNANFQITEQSAKQNLLQGCIDDLKAIGIENINNHVYTYHSASYHQYSEDAINWVSEIFDSARGRIGTVNTDDYDIYQLNSRLNNNTESTIDGWLDDIIANDNILIYYGHGDNSTELEYIATQAIERGIKIITRAEMIELLKN